MFDHETVDWKKTKQHEGQNENSSPADSASDGSVKLLQRSGEKISINVIFVKGEHM